MRLSLRRRPVVAGMLVRVMLRIRLLAIGHARVQPDGNRFRTGRLPQDLGADKGTVTLPGRVTR